MFANLLNRLTSAEPEALADTDARRSLAALLVRIAKADGNYAVEEIRLIDKALATRFDLNPVDAAILRAEAEVLEEEAPDTVRFTREIKAAVAHEDRAGVIASLWEVVLADGVREKEENALMRLVAPMLGINDAESNRIRKDIESRAT